MENKNAVLIGVGVVALLLGLGIGHVTGMMAGNHTPKSEESHASKNMQDMMHEMSAKLENKTGAEFEQAFLDEMIIHHEGAVEMAQMVLKKTTRPELVKLANDIISAQNSEINMMKQWQQVWFGTMGKKE